MSHRAYHNAFSAPGGGLSSGAKKLIPYPPPIVFSFNFARRMSAEFCSKPVCTQGIGFSFHFARGAV